MYIYVYCVGCVYMYYMRRGKRMNEVEKISYIEMEVGRDGGRDGGNKGWNKGGE